MFATKNHLNRACLTMDIVNYNIQFSRGKDNCIDLPRCINEVSGGDIIALQEVERFWARSGMIDQPAEIEKLLPDHYWVYGPYFDVHIPPINPIGKKDTRRRQFGNMLLSRWPILYSRLIQFPKTHYEDKFNMHMGAIEAVVELPDRPMRILSVHLGYLSGVERMTHLDCLLNSLDQGLTAQGAWSGAAEIEGDDWTCGEKAPPVPEETILMGDFNLQWDSREYQRLIDAGFKDAWVESGQPKECGCTVQQGRTADIVMDYKQPRIDYCFVSADLASDIGSVRIDHQAVGSDHLPFWTCLKT